MADNQNNNQGNAALDIAETAFVAPNLIDIGLTLSSKSPVEPTTESQTIIDNELSDSADLGVLSAIGDLLSGV